MKSTFTLLAAFASCSGCAGTIVRGHSIRMGPARPALAARFDVRVHRHPPRAPYDEVGLVEVRLYRHEPGRAEALEELRRRARSLGADGLAAVRVTSAEGFLVATAVAIRVRTPAQGAP